MQKHQQRILGGATFSKLSPPSIARCGGQTGGPPRETVLARMINRLQKLDAEQLQIVEIVAIAIARGGL